MDSNHRRRTSADLQSAPFGHSGTPPSYFQKTSKRLCCRFWSRKCMMFLIQFKLLGKKKQTFFQEK